MNIALDERPHRGEVLMSAFFEAGVPETLFIDDGLRSAVEYGMRKTLSRLKGYGFDYWSLDLISLPLVSGRGRYSVPDNVVSLLDPRLAANSSPNGRVNSLIPISGSEYGWIPDGSLGGAPTVFFFNCLSGAELYVWPVPHSFGNETSIVCDALSWLRYPEGWENWPPYRMEHWLAALAAVLAFEIKKRWPVATSPLDYLEREAERACRLLGPEL